MFLGFSYFKLAAAGIALAVIIGGATVVYLNIKKIGQQEVTISVQQSTINDLNRELVRERLLNEQNKEISKKERQALHGKIIELSQKNTAGAECLDTRISDLFLDDGVRIKPARPDNKKPVH